MSTRQINLIAKTTTAYADSLKGKRLDESHYDRLVEEDADVIRPDGTVLFKLRKAVISAPVAATAYKALRGAVDMFENLNRGTAAGLEMADEVERVYDRPIAKRA